MAIVHIPSLLRDLTAGTARVTVSGRTLRQVIHNLDDQFPGLRGRLLDEDGELQPEIAVAIDGGTEHLGLIQPLMEHTEVHFIPAVSGG